MSHAEEQARARERKRQRQEKLKALDEGQRFYAAQRAREVHITVSRDDLKMLLMHEELIPENTEYVDYVGNDGKGGMRIIAYKFP